MKLADNAAGVVAARHARHQVVTAAMDEMSFLAPVYVGELVFLMASVNDVGRTSMEVGVRVEVENVMTGERRHTSSCYFVMVALDDDGRPVPVPPLEAKTHAQQRRMAQAKVRRELRLARVKALKQVEQDLASSSPA